jgi:dolichol kinase
MAEVWFPLSSLPVIAIGWIWLDQPFVTVSCILFMAWGDAVTGLVRSQIYGKAIKGLWGSLAMFATCLIIAWAFITPFWIGAVAALVATATEWACGDVSKIRWLRWSDDNLMVPFTSFAVAIGLLALTGAL